MAYDDRSPAGNVAMRVLRLVVPWIALIIVVVVLWSMVSDYRSAVETGTPTATVEPTEAVGVAADEPYVKVLSDGLNLRSQPSTAAEVVKVLSAEQQLVFIEEGIGWYHVRDTDGTEGWVAAGGRYTELVQP